MADYGDFNSGFVVRTLSILDSYQGEYEVTLLINCLVGLLILPKERCFDAIPDVRLEEVVDWGLRREHVTQIKCECCGLKLRNIVRQLRNGVAHMRIRPIVEMGEISIVEFKDAGFTARIPIAALRVFALKLASVVM